MPSWLVDDPSVVYVLLGVVALILIAGWWSFRRPGYLIGVGVVALLAVAVWLLAHFIDTDAKQIQRALEAMAAGVNDRKPDQVFAHVSDAFALARMNKDQFRQRAEGHLRSGEVSKVKLWDVDVRSVDRSQRTATVFFKAKAEGVAFRDWQFFNCRATFVLDLDGQWRLKDFQLYAPNIDPGTGEPIELPL